MNNVIVKYVASSGNEYNLKADGLKVKEANFHKYEWAMDVSEYRFGVTVDRWRKEAITYATTLMFVGTYAENLALITALHADFERDIITNKPGRLIWGGCYIETFARASSTYPDETNLWTRNEVEFYCPYPFWIQEKSIQILPIDREATDDRDKGYSYQYWYQYAKNKTITTVDLNYYAETDFKMVAYGPFASLYVTISDNVYNVNYAADAAEYMVIDTRRHGDQRGQAYLVRNNGTRVNVFDYRNPNRPLFQKVPPGTIVINYPRQHGIDLTFFMERSEPVRGDL